MQDVTDLEIAAWGVLGERSPVAQAARVVSAGSQCPPDAALYLMQQRARLTGVPVGQIADDVIARRTSFGPIAHVRAERELPDS